ncbi:MAG: hypothetical protein R3Y32_00205 [Bacillota bacterium]
MFDVIIAITGLVAAITGLIPLVILLCKAICGKVEVKISNKDFVVDDIVFDGQGGFDKNSYGYFTVSIINKKNVACIIEKIECKLYLTKSKYDTISCKDAETGTKYAGQFKYDDIYTIDVNAKSSKQVKVRLILPQKSSKYNKISMTYTVGKKEIENILWERG